MYKNQVNNIDNKKGFDGGLMGVRLGFNFFLYFK
jgi:hypothetical protein